MKYKVCFLPISVCLFQMFCLPAFCQKPHSFTAYASVQYTQTLYDKTKGNNPWAPGIGLHGLINTRSRVNPVIDLSADAYLYDDKVYRFEEDRQTGEIKGIEDIGSVVNMFAGFVVQPLSRLNTSFTAGPSLINGKLYFGIKPSLGIYLTQTQTLVTRLSYINIFNRYPKTGSDFGSIAVSLGIKLF